MGRTQLALVALVLFVQWQSDVASVMGQTVKPTAAPKKKSPPPRPNKAPLAFENDQSRAPPSFKLGSPPPQRSSPPPKASPTPKASPPPPRKAPPPPAVTVKSGKATTAKAKAQNSPPPPGSPEVFPTYGPSQGHKQPNVVLILVDDQDYLLNSTNARYMPNLHKYIANQGMHLNNFLVTTSLCCPSRINLLTGKFTHNTNVTSNQAPQGKQMRAGTALWPGLDT